MIDPIEHALNQGYEIQRRQWNNQKPGRPFPLHWASSLISYAPSTELPDILPPEATVHKILDLYASESDPRRKLWVRRFKTGSLANQSRLMMRLLNRGGCLSAWCYYWSVIDVLTPSEAAEIPQPAVPMLATNTPDGEYLSLIWHITLVAHVPFLKRWLGKVSSPAVNEPFRYTNCREDTPLLATLKQCGLDADIGEAVKLLIDHGADVNVKDDFGATPLHCISLPRVSCDQDVSLRLFDDLLKAGASLTAIDCEGKTPLDWAMMRNRKKLVAAFQAELLAQQLCGKRPQRSPLNPRSRL